MSDRTLLPIIDYKSFSDELGLNISSYIYKKTGSAIWRMTKENTCIFYSELASKLSGYNMSLNDELTHFIFVEKEEAVIFKLRFHNER